MKETKNMDAALRRAFQESVLDRARTIALLDADGVPLVTAPLRSALRIGDVASIGPLDVSVS